MVNHAEGEKLVDMDGVSRADEKKRIDIDISRFKLPMEVLEGGEVREDNAGLFFDRFMDSTFGSLGESVGLISISEHDRPLVIPLGIHTAVGKYGIGGIELKLFYEKIGDLPTFSLHIDGNGGEELVGRMVERAWKQKEIMEKTGRIYSVEDMTEIIEIDATKMVNKRRAVFDEKGYLERRVDRGEYVRGIHEEFMERAFGDRAKHTSYGKVEEKDGSNIANGWEVRGVCINLASRVRKEGTADKEKDTTYQLCVIITNKYPDNEEVFKKACESVRKMKGEIEKTGTMNISGEFGRKCSRSKNIWPPNRRFNGGSGTRGKGGPQKGKLKN